MKREILLFLVLLSLFSSSVAHGGSGHTEKEVKDNSFASDYLDLNHTKHSDVVHPSENDELNMMAVLSSVIIVVLSIILFYIME